MRDVDPVAGDSAVHGGADELVAEMATPTALAANPFRVLGLPSDASSRDLRRHGDRMRITLEVGAGGTVSNGGLAHEIDSYRTATERLKDPRRRLADELFWYWPEAGRPLPAAGDAAGWAESVSRWASEDGDLNRSPTARHNLAVHSLYRLVDVAGDDQAPTVDLADSAADALRTMKTALDRSVGHVVDRAAALDDRRLTEADARDLVRAAASLVPLVAMRIAVGLAEGGRTDEAVAVAAAVRAHSDEATCANALRKTVGPVAKRVGTLATEAGRESSSDPTKGAGVAERLLNRTRSDRYVVRALMKRGDPVRDGMYDDLVQRVLECIISFYNRTDEGRPAKKVLVRAAKLPTSPAVKARVQEAIATLEDNELVNTCWFCGIEPRVTSADYDVDIYGEVKRSFDRMTWQTSQFGVPRCRRCLSEHDRGPRVKLVLTAVLLVLFVPLCLAFGSVGAALFGPSEQTAPNAQVVAAASGATHPVEWFGVSVNIFAAILGAIVQISLFTLLLLRLDSSRKRAREFPPLKATLASGWHLGTRPAGTT